MRELLEAALIQSANDAADALADLRRPRDESRFVAMMNRAGAASSGSGDTHFVRPDGLDAAGHVSSARDVTLLARLLMHRPVVRQIVRQRGATISGGRSLHTWNDLLYSYPGIFGVKTGHTSAAGWSQVAAARRRGVTVYATLLGSPDRGRRNADLAELLDWGFSRYRPAAVVVRGRAYAQAELGYGRKPLTLVAARSLMPTVRVDRPARAAGRRGRRVVELPVRRGQALGEVRVYQRGRLVGVTRLVAAPLGRAARDRRPRRLVRGAYPAPHVGLVLVIVTVTMNAAIDRTLTVPNFQRGQRHRASRGSRSRAARGSTSRGR